MATVEALHRYPVKGFPGQALSRAVVRTGDGIEGDRAMAFTNGRVPAHPGTWSHCDEFTALKNDTSLQHWQVDAEQRPGGGIEVVLVSPDGHQVQADSSDPQSLDDAGRQLSGLLAPGGHNPRHLVAAQQGMFDSRVSGLSLINPATVRLLAASAGVDVDPLRFRGNVLLGGLEPCAELDWIGRIVTIGGVRLWVRSAIERCSATRVNPTTGEVDVNVPQLLATHMGHQHCGVYGVVLDGGTLAVGDDVVVGERIAGAPTRAPAQAWKPRTSPRMAEVGDVTILDADSETPVARVRLVDPQGWMAALWAPGMNLRLHLVVDGVAVWRTYTITRVDGDVVELLVALNGSVSRQVAALRPGDGVVVSGPYGRLTSETLGARPTAAVVAGIGATPALALSGVIPGMPVLHVERPATASEVHRELVDADALGHVQRWSTAAQGRPGPEDIAAWLRTTAGSGRLEVVACGPAGFGTAVREAAELSGVVDAVHEEVFASPMDPHLVAQPDLPIARVEVVGEATSVEWTPTSGYLLDALEQAGIGVDSTCRGGSCGSCVMHLDAGEVTYPIEPAAAVADDEVIACSAFPVGDVRLSR